MKLSLCMIVKNEEENLPRCLESVKDIVDEMIIVDTGSTDHTVEIARNYGAKVHLFEWNGNFSDARNYSLKHASGEWILLMDGDDELEKEHRTRVLDLVNAGDADAYFFKTLSFIGEKPGLDVMNNLNVRLIRNHQGYFFSNPIHEQIYCNIKQINPEARIVNEDIIVYHYGYLAKNIISQDKRNRNIKILEKELEQNPGYGFALFNLGNEYFAMGHNKKALEYYEMAHKNFDPLQGYSSKLVLKMTNCYMNLGKYEDALRLIGEGIKVYPDFTELEHFRGMIHKGFGRYTLALRSFNRCIQMGESPMEISVIIGVGTYRSCYLIGDIFSDLEDYDEAEQWYEKCLKDAPHFTPVIPKLIHTYCKKGYSNKQMEEKIKGLEDIAKEDFSVILYDTLMEERYYELALYYIKEIGKRDIKNEKLRYYEGLCNLLLRKYKNAAKIMRAFEGTSPYYVKGKCLEALCKVIEGKVIGAQRTLKDRQLDPLDKKVKVYKAWIHFIKSGELGVLSDNEKESKEYTPIIFQLLSILSELHEFELFEKTLQLLNSIADKSVLLRLAKLYCHAGCYRLAYEELIRSIKTFGLIDLEGIQQLRRLKLYGY